MITAANLASHELVGLEASVAGSPNPSVVGLNGRVVDETKYMITLRTARGPRSVPKAGTRWRFSVGGRPVELDGSRIAARPHDRAGRGR